MIKGEINTLNGYRGFAGILPTSY